MNAIKPKYNELNSKLWLLCLSVFFMRLGQFMVLPFLAIFMLNQFNSSPMIIGCAIGAGPFAYSVSCIHAGYLNDKWGSKISMIWSLLLAASAFLTMFFLKSAIAYILLNALIGMCR